MGKILEYRETLSLEEAAKYLGRFFDEPLSKADVLRLSLDGHLTVTADLFNRAPGHWGRVVSEKHARMWISPAPDVDPSEITLPQEPLVRISQLDPELRKLIDNGKAILSLADEVIPGAGIVQFSDKVSMLGGLWDLPMLGAERFDIENRFRCHIGGPEIDIEIFESYYLRKDLKTFARLMETTDGGKIEDPAFSPLTRFQAACSLPRDAQLVVRCSEIKRFAESVKAGHKAQEKVLSTSERNSLLCIIATLSKRAGIDPNAHGSATRIAQFAQRDGIQISDETVRKFLRRIPDAVEARTK